MDNKEKGKKLDESPEKLTMCMYCKQVTTLEGKEYNGGKEKVERSLKALRISHGCCTTETCLGDQARSLYPGSTQEFINRMVADTIEQLKIENEAEYC